MAFSDQHVKCALCGEVIAGPAGRASLTGKGLLCPDCEGEVAKRSFNSAVVHLQEFMNDLDKRAAELLRHTSNGGQFTESPAALIGSSILNQSKPWTPEMREQALYGLGMLAVLVAVREDTAKMQAARRGA